ncbi:MAG: polyprotein [Hangzhou dicistro-like virus 2]|nr:MAG: polyprotein [Hangzhou dicistro-like virus 2]
MKMAMNFEYPSVNLSRTFAAPSESLVLSGQSESTLSLPMYANCPKLEHTSSEQWTCEDLKMYDDYWSNRWSEHPLNHADYLYSSQIGNWHGRFDWERFVLIKDAVWKHMKHLKELPRRTAPREWPQVYVGREQTPVNKPYHSWFKNTDEDPDEVLTQCTNGTVKNGFYSFTRANYEAALHYTKHIWKPRCTYNKMKKNWQQVISPICFRFLTDLHDEITGLSRKKITTAIGFMGEVDDLYTSVETTENLMEVDIVSASVNRNPGACLLPEDVAQIEEEHKIGGNKFKSFVPKDKKLDLGGGRNFRTTREIKYEPFRWYPKIEIPRKSKVHKPTDLGSNFLDQLPEIYMNIGRPDLTWRIVCADRPLWLQKRIYRTVFQEWMMRRVRQRWDDDIHFGDYQEWQDLQYIPEGLEKECPKTRDYTEKYSRWLLAYTALFQRHKDKMYVLSHRGRFGYLTKWDLALFQRQKNSITAISPSLMDKYKKDWNHALKGDMLIPQSYVEEADFMLDLLSKLSLKPNNIHLITASMRALEIIWCRWLNGEFDEQKTKPECWDAVKDKIWEAQGGSIPVEKEFWEEPRNDRPYWLIIRHVNENAPNQVYEAQVGETPVASASGGPTAVDPTAKPMDDKIITGGEKKVTLTMADDRPKEEAKIMPAKKPDVQETLRKEYYDMMSIVERPMLIDRVNWSTTDELGKYLWSKVVPNVYFSATEAPKTVCQNLNASYVLAMFGSARFDMVIRIQMNSVKFQQGQLKLIFEYFCDKSRSTVCFHNLLAFPNVSLDATDSNSVELRVPFTNFRDAFPIYNDPNEEYTYFGRVHLVVWNELMTGPTGSTDASISIWMWLENLECFQLCNAKDPGKVTFASKIRDDLTSIKTGPGLPVSVSVARTFMEPSGIIWEPQMMESLLETGTGIVSDIGANLVEQLLGRISRGSNSKPGMVLPPQPVVQMVSSNASFGNGPDLSQRISLESVCARGPDPWVPKMNTLLDLIKIKSRIKVVTWKVDDMENDVIVTLPVTPMINAVNSDKRQTSEVFYKPLADLGGCGPRNLVKKSIITYKREGSTLDYLSNYYFFWRGGILYIFEIVKTGMATGRLSLRYEPYASLDSATLECQKLATPGAIWDVHETSVMKFKAPYMSTQPFLCTQYKSVGNIHNRDSYSTCNGVIQLSVVNRLKITTGIAKEVQINVYMCGADDFEFAVHAPLDGIMKIGPYTELELQDAGPAPGFNNIVCNRLYYYMTIPARLGWEETKTVVIAGDTYVYGVMDKTQTEDFHVGGPMVRRLAADDGRGAFIRNVLKLEEQIEADKQLISEDVCLIPRMETFDAAYRLTSDFVKNWTSTPFPKWNIIEKQRMAAWLAVALMGTKAWQIEALPLATVREEVHPTGKMFFFKLLTPEYEAEGKESEVTAAISKGVEDQYIDPFAGFAPPKRKTKDLFGEEFSDMYKSMRRYTIWKTMEPYFDTRGGNSGDGLVVAIDNKETMEDCANMLTAELKNYCVETRIEVTPYMPYHVVGADHHTIISAHKDTEDMISSLRPYRYRYGGGINAGTKASLIPSRFFGELFTFWRGSMRYRFTFPKIGLDQGNNWVLITYHPRMFTSSTWGFSNSSMVHMQRVRDMSKLGFIMYQGTVQANIEVEVPSYSKYSHLYMSDIADDTTQAGTICIYTPLLFDGDFTCSGVPVDLTKQTMRGVPMWVWIAVGDDFEMNHIRPAPEVHLWPDFWNKIIDPKEDSYGYDRWSSFSDKEEDIPKQLGEVRKSTGHLLQIENPIKSVTGAFGLWGKWNRTAVVAPAQSDAEKVITFSWNKGFPKKVEYVAQGGSENGSDDESVSDVSTTRDEVDHVLLSAMQAVKAIPSLIADFKSVAVVATDVMKDVKETVKVAGDAIIAASEGTTKVTESIEESAGTVSKMATYAFNATRVGLFFKGILDALKADNWSDRWMPIAMCAMSLGLSPEVVTSAGEWLMGIVSDIFGPKKVHEDHKPQNWEDTWDNSWESFIEEHASVFKMIAAGAITILTFYFTSSAPTNARGVTGFATDMLHKLRNFAIVGSALKTLDWMFKWVSQVLVSAAVTVADWVSGGMVTAHRMSAHYPDVIAWLQSIEKFNTENWRMQLAWNSEARMELWKQMDVGDDLLAKLGSKAGSLYTTLMRGKIALTKAHDAAVTTRAVSPFRIDPYHICLYGHPGVGKSAILAFVMNFVSDQLKLPRAHRFYPRGDVDKFWSNYLGQSVVIIDDLFQDRKASAIKELITMKSNMAMPLNMADTDEKGRYFISKLIGTTTNTAYPRPDDITNYHALWRRRNLLVNVKKVSAINSPPKSDWSDLLFDIMESNPADGNSSQVLIANMNLMDFLVYCANQAEEYLEAQRKLMFSGLKGRLAHQVRETELDAKASMKVTSNLQMMKTLLKSKSNIDVEFLKTWIVSLNSDDYRDIMRDNEMREALEQYEVFKIWKNEQVRIASLCDFFRAAHTMDDETLVAQIEYYLDQHLLLCEDTGEELKKYWPFFGGEKVTSMGYIQEVLKGDKPVHRKWFPQVLDIDDLLLEVPDRAKEIENRALERRNAAQRDIKHRSNMSLGYDCIAAEYQRRYREYREVVLKDDAEIKTYVQTAFPHIKSEWQDEMVVEFGKVFEWAHESKKALLEGAHSDQLDVNISTLFSKRYDKYWKKDDNGNWKMFFPETIDDEDYEACGLWDICEMKWTQKDINNHKAESPSDNNVSPWILKAKTYFESQKQKTTNWFLEHPTLTTGLKLAGAVAALFGAYKVVSWVCPRIIDQIKVTLSTIFGWGAMKVGAERLEHWKGVGKNAYSVSKAKLGEYFDWARNWMRGSGDAELVEMSDNEEIVVLFAEQMERLVPTTKTLLKLKGQLPEGKRVMNAYMLGQDRKRPEEKEKTLAQRAKEPLNYDPHGSQDAVASDVRNNKVVNNICRVSWTDGRIIKCMSGIFVQGRTLMVPRHFFHGIQEGTVFSIRLEKNIEYFDAFQSNRCVVLDGVDACLYQCGPRVGQFKKLTHHFISETELKFSQTDATLNLLTETLVVVVQLVKAKLVKDIKYDLHGTEYANNVAWEYEAITSSGDCGAVLMADNTSVRSKILGFHVCGVRGQNAGCSCIVTKEALLAAMNLLPDQDLQAPTWNAQDLCDYDEERMSIRPQGNFILGGAVKASRAVRLPHKTEIEPSAIHDMVREHVTEPAVLDKMDPRLEEKVSPLLIAISKYGVHVRPFPPDDIQAVKGELLQEVLTWEGSMGKRLLTDYEAVWGNENIDFLDRMNMGASPGYPYTLSRPSGEKGKAYLYDINSEDGIACDRYRNEYKSRERLAQEGIRKHSVWTDCLKDERRPLAKIKAGKTRSFTLPPADFVQLCRKYFGAFNVAFYQNCLKSFSAVGIDPYSYQWTQLWQYLRSNSNLGFGGDFKNFDGIADPDLISAFFDIVEEWYKKNNPDYKPIDACVRKVLVDEMIKTVIICKNSIYEKLQGNSSGNPETVIINTFIHMFLLMLAWIGLARMYMACMMSLYFFRKNVKAMIYGDDGVYSVKYETAKWFNLINMGKYLESYGITYTDESKTGLSYGVRPIRECTFLKNGFTKLEGTRYMLAPISVDTIYELTNWVRKSDDPIAQLRENLEDVFSFAFHHGEEFFDSLLAGVNEALAKRNLRGVFQSYKIQKEMFLAKCLA